MMNNLRNSRLTKGQVEMNVKVQYAEQNNRMVNNVSMDTVVKPQEIEPLLDRLSVIYHRRFTLKRRKPRRGGWKISTLVGYLYHRQDEFPPLE